MPVTPGLAGRVMPPTPPYDVSRTAIADFARAVGADDPVHHDLAVAKACGHPDVIAPPTYPIVVASIAMQSLLDDPEVGIELRNVVHADQRFTVVRPVRAGDVLTARLRVVSVRSAAGADLIATSSDVTTVDDEPVCTATATLVHRPGGTER